jgi:hypothetical protein
MSEKRNMKEVVEKALEEVLKKYKKLNHNNEEEEVVIEPFNLIDPELAEEIGEIQEFTNLSDIVHPEACPSVESVEIHEEDIVPDEFKDSFVSTEELLDIADEIKPLDADNIILCDVGGNERILVNGENCNIRRIPLLKLVLLTPPNLQILDDIMINGNLESVGEIELKVVFNIDGQYIIINSDIQSLITVGLLSVLEDDDEDVIPTYSCSPVEWRGIVSKISLEELESILNN